MPSKIQFRRDTSEAWESGNPVLAPGEPGIDLTTLALKVGDGVTPWINLGRASGGAVGAYAANGLVIVGDSIYFKVNSGNPILSSATRSGSTATITLNTNFSAGGDPNMVGQYIQPGQKISINDAAFASTQPGAPDYAGGVPNEAKLKWNGVHTILTRTHVDASSTRLTFAIDPTAAASLSGPHTVATSDLGSAWVGFGNDTSRADSIIGWLQKSIKQRFNILGACCLPGGESTDLARQYRYVVAPNPGAAVMLLIGTNDMHSGAITPEMTLDNITSFLQLCGDRPVFVSTIPPFGSPYSDAEPGARKIRDLLTRNAKIRRLPLSYPNVRILDLFAWVTDPNSVNRAGNHTEASGFIPGDGSTNYKVCFAKPGYISADNIHPSPLGAQAAGVQGAAAIESWLGANPDPFVASRFDDPQVLRVVDSGSATPGPYPQLLANPLFWAAGGNLLASGGGTPWTGSGTAVGGTKCAPQYWDADIYVGASNVTACLSELIARDDGCGHDWVITLTATSAVLIQIISNVSGLASHWARATVDHRYALRANLQFESNAGNLSFFYLQNGVTNYSGIDQVSQDGLYGMSAAPYHVPSAGVWCETPPLAFDGSASGAYPLIQIATSGAVSGLKLKIGRIGCHDLDI